MSRYFPLLAIFFLLGCAEDHPLPSYSANENLLVTGFPGIPSDAQDVAERLASCTHLSGEINGDRSDRDKEIFSTMNELHCETIDQEVLGIRKKYPDNQAVQKALDAAAQL